MHWALTQHSQPAHVLDGQKTPVGTYPTPVTVLAWGSMQSGVLSRWSEAGVEADHMQFSAVPLTMQRHFLLFVRWLGTLVLQPAGQDVGTLYGTAAPFLVPHRWLYWELYCEPAAGTVDCQAHDVLLVTAHPRSPG